MCPNRFKIPITLLLTEKLFTTDPNISCLDGMFSQMMQQIKFLQRRIIFVVVYVCDDLQFALCLVHILDNVKIYTSFLVVLLHLVIIYLSVSNVLVTDLFIHSQYIFAAEKLLDVTWTLFSKETSQELPQNLSYH